ncbi:MAG: BrnT family toxin [Desulfovibrionaceae bacterium]|nr:BrnT family toxin [Desulfovibrionaceae bacterium]
MIVVAHTYRSKSGEEIIRIISARKATSHERRQYEQ